jgi:hypothetical protein
VTSATLASTIPFGEEIDGDTFERIGDTAREPVRARAHRIIGAHYFTTLGLRMVRGREFTLAEESSDAAPAVAIIDEAFARRLFGDANPVGQMIRFAREGDRSGSSQTLLEIVGVAPPMYEELLDKAPPTHVYVPTGRNFRATMHIHARLAPGAGESGALDEIRQSIRATDPELPVLALSTFRTFHDRGLELLALRGSAVVFTGLGSFALVLSVVGVYGLRSYLVSQRTREIGIRMALGAGARQVIAMVAGDGLKLTATGLALGVPLAIAVSVGLRSVFVDVGGVDIVVLVVATFALGITALAASVIPARRAARIDPQSALRTE